MEAAEYYAALIELSPRLMRLATCLTGSVQDAADIHAETLCRALESRRRFRPDWPLWPFLATIMRNLHKNECRRLANFRRMREAMKGTQQISAATGGTQIDLHTIDRYRRQEVRMFAEGYTYKEIAEEVGVCVGTIQSRIAINRRRLQNLLSD